MQITINNVRFALQQSLSSAFPQITVLSTEPSTPTSTYFLVKLLKFTQAQEYGRRYRRSFPFNISFVTDDSSSDQLYETAELVIDAIKQISVGDNRLTGHNLSIEMIEGRLHFFITYEMLVREHLQESEKMQQFEGGITVE